MARLTHTINPGAATRGRGYRAEAQAVCGRWVLDTHDAGDPDPTCPDCKAQADDDAETSAVLDKLVAEQQARSYAAHLARVQAHRERQQLQGGAR